MSIPTPSALFLDLAEKQARLSRGVDQALSPHGISFTEFVVMEKLQQAPQRRLRRIDLAHAVGLTASGITRMLNPMEKIGLVVKHASERDARVSFVELTGSGQRLLAEAQETFARYADHTLQALRDADRRELSRLLAAVR